MNIKKRSDVVIYIRHQLEFCLANKDKKCGRYHYGKVELRQLMDYIYGEEPQEENEKIK